MEFDINKSQLSALGKLQQPKSLNMTKEEVIKELKETRIINSGMLKVLKMPFEVWLRYCNLKTDAHFVTHVNATLVIANMKLIDGIR
mgnify:CR=1 FL=1